MNILKETSYMDIAESRLMFLLCAGVITFVIVQAVLFFRKSYNRGKEIGMPTSDLNKVVVNSAIFSIIPAIAILLFLVVLIPGLGLYFPWLRLSVIGSGVYENLVAGTITQQAGYEAIGDIDSELFMVILFSMSVGILTSPILTIFALKPFLGKINSLEHQKETFGPEIVPTIFPALYIAIALPLILPALTIVDRKVESITIPTTAIGAFIAASICVVSLGKLSEKLNVPVLKDFSFPLSIFAGMIAALLLNLAGVS